MAAIHAAAAIRARTASRERLRTQHPRFDMVPHHPMLRMSQFEVWARACPEEEDGFPRAEGCPPASLMRFAMTKSCVEGGECSICLMAYQAGKELSELPCGHCFHEECLRNWVIRVGNCPTCRWDGVRTSPRTMKARQQSFAADVARIREQLAAHQQAAETARTSASSCVCVVS